MRSRLPAPEHHLLSCWMGSKRVVLAVSAALVVSIAAAEAEAQTLRGIASVTDGDTIKIGGQAIRLWGVDAPERSQACKDKSGRSYRCGERASAALTSFIRAKSLACAQRDKDAFGRVVALCTVNGVDVGRWLVSQGWAIDFTRYSAGYYRAVEAEARLGRRGIWNGSFQSPSDYRHNGSNYTRAPATARSAVEAVGPGAKGCAIKGNIGSAGTRIAHSPGQRDYAATVIDEAKGERWFCTAAEAARSGWRPAQR